MRAFRMNHLRVETSRFALHFDRDYGIQKLTGWTAFVDGVLVAGLQPLHVAIWRMWKFRNWDRNI